MAGRPPRYTGTCRALTDVFARRETRRGTQADAAFRRPRRDGIIEFIDLVHGPQRFSSADIGDFIVRREDGTAAFFFCNAVDDSVMGVTHVLRGDDHLTNTPRQLMLLDALGMRRPDYGHVGLLVGADGAPLSKRHGSTSVRDFRERGFLPAALLNHLFHLGHTADVDGWLPPAELPAHFRPEHLGRASARFEESQLLHWQKETLRHMSTPEIAAWLGLPDSTAFVELVRHNVVLPADAQPWVSVVRGELPPLGAEEQRVVAAAGGAFLRGGGSGTGSGGPGSARARRAAQAGDRTEAVRNSTCLCGWRSPARPTGRNSRPPEAHAPETARRRLESHARDT